jgi:DNA-binding NarL/FixJ family response regulator
MNPAAPSAARPAPARRTGPVSVVLVDDHDLVRLLLRRAIADHGGLRVSGEAVDADAGVALVGRLRPDVVVLDLGLGAEDALAAPAAIRALVPACGILIFSAYDAERHAPAVLRAGADRYVEKRAGFQAAVTAVAALAASRAAAAPEPMGPDAAPAP